MSGNLEQFGQRVMSGQMTGPIGSLLRGVLRTAEPAYAKVVASRNAAYDKGKKPITPLGRPTISIGNITTGGTGKTPMVRWLGQQLINAGIKPGVLLRGYRSSGTVGSDEQVMLSQFLGDHAVIQANPDRVAGATAVIAKAPDVGAFILDDGFQHRRVHRDLDIVLVSAIEPFGYGHLLPRGLLREPPVGLKRANAVVITHARQVSAEALESIKTMLRKSYPVGPIYHADHVPTGFRTAKVPASDRVDQFDDDVQDQPVLAVCGLGEPRAFEAQLKAMGARVVGTEWFRDHHAYSANDLEAIYAKAESIGAKIIVTTEKDWVKLETLPRRGDAPPIWRLDVLIRFWWSDESMLLEQVMAAIAHPRR